MISRRDIPGLIGLFAAVVCAVIPLPAQSFSIQSSFSDPCHETMAINASEGVLSDIPASSVTVPGDEKLERLRREYLEMIDGRTAALDEETRFLLFSLVLGVRQPDTDGNSATNLESLRMSHADPSGEGQYKHASRAADDDYEQGNASVIEGVRQLILELTGEARSYAALPSEQQNIKVDFYLDFYGQIRVPVWAPLYLIGKAMHTLQDTFSHSIRSDQHDLHRIAHVLNYIDAIHSGFDEDRDGLAHSDYMDRCMSKDIEDLFDAAVEASNELLLAGLQQAGGSDGEEVEQVLDNWVVLLPGCTKENDFCENTRWLEAVRKDQTGPYLKEAFSCNSIGHSKDKKEIIRLLLLLF